VGQTPKAELRNTYRETTGISNRGSWGITVSWPEFTYYWSNISGTEIEAQKASIAYTCDVEYLLSLGDHFAFEQTNWDYKTNKKLMKKIHDHV
jgi:hypothetical protein